MSGLVQTDGVADENLISAADRAIEVTLTKSNLHFLIDEGRGLGPWVFGFGFWS
jgi:hypothetical protein